jgi:hypothetical protein
VHLQGKPFDADGALREFGTRVDGERIENSQLTFEHNTNVSYGRTSLDDLAPRGHCDVYLTKGVDAATFAEVEAVVDELAPRLADLGLADQGTAFVSAMMRFRTFGFLSSPRCALSASFRIETPPGRPIFPKFSTQVLGPGCTKLFLEAEG